MQEIKQNQWILPFSFYQNQSNDFLGIGHKIILNAPSPEVCTFSDWCLSRHNDEVEIYLKTKLGESLILKGFMTDKEYKNFERIWIRFVDRRNEILDLNLLHFEFNILT